MADGVNDYWESSMLTLSNGDIVAFVSRNGPESAGGVGSGRIVSATSSNGGQTWSAPVLMSATIDAEYPRGFQNSSGSVEVVYSRYIDVSHMPNGTTPYYDFMANGYPGTDVHVVWTNDEGMTYFGDNTLYHNPNNSSSLHPYIAAETTHRQTPCASCQVDLLFIGQATSGPWGMYEMQSTNQGASWGSPNWVAYSAWSQPFNIDPMFTIGCRGFFMSYTGGGGDQRVMNRRYDSSANCSIN
jgi:hypothetical protein